MLLAAGPTTARAESLADAIALAYSSNPNLQSQRAQLRALDEGYVQAASQLRPQLGLGVTGTVFTGQQNSFGTAAQVDTNSGSANLTLTQPIYTGGRVTTAIRASEADILAGREGLRATETQLVQAVVQAYADVLRDQRISDIRQQQTAELQKQYEDNELRFKAGEITRTDVLQALSQLQGAQAQLALSRSQLQISRGTYAAIVGQNPGRLDPAPPFPNVPQTVDQAFDAAEADNPQLQRARFTEQASRWRIAEARSANRPTVTVQGRFGYVGQLEPLQSDRYLRQFTATATINQPLFTGGLNRSNIRRAGELNTSDRVQIESARRSAVQGVSQAWNQMTASRAAAAISARQVDTAREYFADTNEEYRVGQKSTLDVIIAEQTLRGAEINQVAGERDAYVATSALLGASGLLSASALVRDLPTYDANASFQKIKRRGATPIDGAIRAIDALGAPSPGRVRPIAAPPLPAQAVSRPGVPAPDGALVTAVPTTPEAGTVSPATPATLGRDVGSPPVDRP